jgi:hypothetical protein
MTTEEMEDMVKQVYFYCETEQIDPKGIYPDGNLNLLEFASKLIALWEAQKQATPAPAWSGHAGEPS